MRSARLALTALLYLGLAALLAAAPLPGQQITLSLDRFQKLWDQAHPAPVVPPPPAVPLALESARIDITAGADSARLVSEIAVTLTPGGSTEWQTLPLAGLGALLGVTAPGFEAEVGEASGVPVVRLRGAGRHRMTVESVVPLAADPAAVEAERSLEVKLPAAGWVTGSLAAGPLARPLSETGIRRVESLGGGSVREEGPGRWSLVGEPGTSLRLRLFGRPAPAASPAADEPLSFDAETASALAVSRARRRLTAFVGVHVRSGRPERLERLSLPLPPGYEVLSVNGDRVADWEAAAGTLAVRLRRAAARDLEVEVQLAADPAPEVDCPLLVPAGARTVRGALKVAVRGNDGLLEPVDGRAVERLPLEQAASFAEGFRQAPGEPLRAAAGTGPGPRWSVTWAIGGDVLTGQIDRLVIEALLGEAGTAHYQVWAEVRNGVATLEFALPAGARLLAARRDGGEVTLGSAGSGGGWAVPMVVREAPQIVYLEALLAAELPAGGGRLVLPLPRLGVPASRVEVRLLAPPGFRYSLAEPGRAGALGSPPGASAGPAPSPTPAAFLAAPPGFAVLEAAWAGWSKEPPPLLVDVVPASSGRSRR